MVTMENSFPVSLEMLFPPFRKFIIESYNFSESIGVVPRSPRHIMQLSQQLTYKDLNKTIAYCMSNKVVCTTKCRKILILLKF